MSGCEDLSPFALQVQGDSMEPEFPDKAIIVIDPGYPVENGLYIACDYRGETVLRQMIIDGEQRFLKPVNPAYPTVEVSAPLKIHGVVVQKTTREKGQRRQVKHYV